MARRAVEPASGPGIDLGALRERFLALNRARLRRVRETLGPARAQWLELLPLLLHENHPLLPGYVGRAAPAGLPGYGPGAEAVRAARRIAPGFRPRRRAYRRFALEALFLMGSAGSLGHTRESDLDVWVCHDPGLDAEARALLAAKCAALERWARERFGLETHLYPVDPERFRAGEHASLAADGCGALQHHLLLDEFYRSAVLVAGRRPLWWLVPVERERAGYAEEAARLVGRRFVRPGECVDLGSPLPLPAAELFDAALWQLYKALDSPYKSVLKILLLESYVAGLPDGDLACHDLKRAVHEGSTDADALDPYVLMIERIERHLAAPADRARRELARRCLYFKSRIALSRPGSGWRRALMARLAARWGWDRGRLHLLDARPRWKIERVLEERALIEALLRDSFGRLAAFAGARLRDGGRAAGDLEVVARRLKSAAEHAPGKIEVINPGISEDLSEPGLTLVHEAEGTWRLEREGSRTPLKRAETPVALLAWAHVNGLVAPSTVLRFDAPGTDLTPAEVHGVVRALAEHLPADACRRGPPPEALRAPPRLAAALAFADVGHDPCARHRRLGIELATARSDPLSHGSGRTCLVRTIDLVARTTWGEVLVQRFAGETAVADLVAELCAWTPPGQGGGAPPPVPVRCFVAGHGPAIARRLEGLLAQAQAAWYGPRGHPLARLVVEIGAGFQVLEPEHGVPRPVLARDRDALLEVLALPRERWAPVVLEEALAAREPVLAAACRAAAPGRVTVAWHARGGTLEVVVADERGSVVAWRQPWRRQVPALRALAAFLGAATRRVAALCGEAPPAVAWYRVDGSGETAKAVETPPPQPAEGALALRAVARHDGTGGLAWSLECGRRRFDPSQEPGAASADGRPPSPGAPTHGTTHDLRTRQEQAFEAAARTRGREAASRGEGGRPPSPGAPTHGTTHDLRTRQEQVFEAAARHVVALRAAGEPYPVWLADVDLPRGALPGAAQTAVFLRWKLRLEARLNARVAALEGAA